MTERPLRRRTDVARRAARRFQRSRTGRGVVAFLVLIGVIAGAIAINNAIANRAVDRAQLAHQISVLNAKVATQSRQFALEAREQTQALANERRRSILASCETQNAQHTSSLRELRVLVAQADRRFRARYQRRQIAASAQPFVLLIRSFFPLRDCQQVLAQQTRP